MTNDELDALDRECAVEVMGLGPNEWFERNAEEFRRATGMMAPGKDQAPGEVGTFEERSIAWDSWFMRRKPWSPTRDARDCGEMEARLCEMGIIKTDTWLMMEEANPAYVSHVIGEDCVTRCGSGPTPLIAKVRAALAFVRARGESKP